MRDSERQDREQQDDRPLAPWQWQLHEVIFEADTPAGRAFDVGLMIAIGLSVIAVMLESVEAVRVGWGPWLRAAEWGFTLLFTVEYALRLACVGRPKQYATSFWGIVDLLAVLPTYLSIFVHGSQALMVIRILRLVRVFRVFGLSSYVNEAQALTAALRATTRKTVVFLLVVLSLVLILGSAMYLIEGQQEGTQFTSIPMSVYWAIVTMTTVGYGDLAPTTPTGRAIASVAMILGYCIIIVPTGIFSVEIITAAKHEITTQACPSCSLEGHDADAVHCKYCGARL